MPLQGIMTRGEIITEALQLGGNPGLTTRAQNFLNLFLDHLYRVFDWDFLLKEASISGSSYTFTLPADYGRVLSVSLDAVGSTAIGLEPLIQASYPDLWQRTRVDNANGTRTSSAPTHFAISPTTPSGIVWPVPSNSWTGKMLYYHIPAELTSDGEYPVFPHSLALVNAVTNYVESYERESLQILIERAADEVLKKYANAHFDEGRAGHMSVGMDPNVFRWDRYRES